MMNQLTRSSVRKHITGDFITCLENNASMFPEYKSYCWGNTASK